MWKHYCGQILQSADVTLKIRLRSPEHNQLFHRHNAVYIQAWLKSIR